MMNQSKRPQVWIMAVVFLLLSAVLTEVLRPGYAEYYHAATMRRPGDFRDDTGSRSVASGTAFQTLLPTFLGIREVIASLMWVRADDYFHRGEYKPILVMVHEITAIDPHQLDVYATGAWHMAYNFMDKRLIEDGVRFLDEGCRNNQEVYDLFFERGYMHYDKTKNYPEAVVAYRESSIKGQSSGVDHAPAYVRHQLAHALEKMGDIDQCVKQWETNVAASTEESKVMKDQYGPMSPNLQAAYHNLYITERRRNERMATLAETAGNRAEALRLRQANVALADKWIAENRADANIHKDREDQLVQVERLQKGKLNPAPPTDLDLHFTVTRVSPRLLEVAGTINALDLSRIHVQFQDKDYDAIRNHGLDYKMANGSLEWDDTSIRQGKFNYKLKLNRDPAEMDRAPSDIYPLKSDQYLLSLTYDPRKQAAFIQDRYGWNGEGLTAKGGMLKIDDSHAGVMYGKRFPLRTVEKSITLSKADITDPGTKVLYKQ